MNRTPLQLIVIIVAVALLGAALGYFLGHGSRAPAMPAAVTGGRAVLYWYDPMRPEQHFDKPGRSPYMDMALLPRYADAPPAPGLAASTAGTAAAPAAVRIDPGVTQNLGVRYATVESAPWSEGFDAAGSVVYDERHVVVIQARAGGFVTSVHQHAPGDVVARGAALVDLQVPEWRGAQAEFAALLKGGDRALIDAARTRLELLGMPAELVGRVEATGEPQPTFTITAPLAGAIESLDARVGMAVSAGATLVKLNGIGSVWLEAAVPEAQGALATPGNRVEARLAAFAGESFRGRVLAVLPEANAETRTLRVRIEIPNPGGRLRPGMYAQVHLQAGQPRQLLQVPSEAVIRTGVRDLVLIVGKDGGFVPVDVRLGPEAGGRTVVLEGLEAGQRVVASGQFLIDSEASLQGVLTRLRGAAPAVPAAPEYAAQGRVVEVGDRSVTVAHEAIAGLGWPAMTMPFRLARPGLAASLREGDAIRFHLRQEGDEFVVVQLERSGSPR